MQPSMTVFLALTSRYVCKGTVKAEPLKQLEINAERCHGSRLVWVPHREKQKEFICFDFSPYLFNETCEK